MKLRSQEQLREGEGGGRVSEKAGRENVHRVDCDAI